MPAKIKGGKKFRRFVQRARQAKGRSVSHVDVGFFNDAKYPDGTSVSWVAATHEFGYGVPERPFFRRAIKGAKEALLPVLIKSINPKTMVFDEMAAGTLGAVMAGRIQVSITTLREPPNSPATIKAKGGKANPLIDTGFMRQSVTWRVTH